MIYQNNIDYFCNVNIDRILNVNTIFTILQNYNIFQNRQRKYYKIYNIITIKIIITMQTNEIEQNGGIEIIDRSKGWEKGKEYIINTHGKLMYNAVRARIIAEVPLYRRQDYRLYMKGMYIMSADKIYKIEKILEYYKISPSDFWGSAVQTNNSAEKDEVLESESLKQL